jgi:large subunit ribosomal protein L15
VADTLSKLVKPVGATQVKLRKGRGPGSGLGKTAGRGQKGQYARTGGFKPYFEGGQTPLQRRLPKRGFTNPFPTKVCAINVGDLDVFAAGANVDEKALRDRGLVKGQFDGIKILGDGDITKAIVVTANSFSKSAQEKIQKAGGKTLLVSAAKAGE